jgi:hypothetical protein
MLIKFAIAFLHGFVEADDGFGDLLLEVSEEPLNDGKHLGFGLADSFLELFLLFGFLGLMFLDVDAVVIEVFDKFLEKSIEVSHNFVHTKVRR